MNARSSSISAAVRRLELRGGMSDEDFRAARDRVIALVETGAPDATA